MLLLAGALVSITMQLTLPEGLRHIFGQLFYSIFYFSVISKTFKTHMHAITIETSNEVAVL